MDDPAPWQLFVSWSLGLLITAGGALAVVLTIRHGIFVGRLHRRGIRTPGVVVGHAKGGAGDIDRPVLRFTDQHGRLQTFASERTPETFVPLGQHQDVVYLPDRPEKAMLYRANTSPLRRAWPVLASALCLGGGLATIVGLGLGGVRVQISPSDEWIFLAVFWPLSFLVLGAIWVFLVSQIRKVLSLRRNGIRTLGTVVRAGPGSELVVEFTDPSGRRIQFSDLKKRRFGTRVPVVHSERVPEDAQIDSLSRLMGNLLVFSFFSVLCVGAFVLSLR